MRQALNIIRHKTPHNHLYLFSSVNSPHAQCRLVLNLVYVCLFHLYNLVKILPTAHFVYIIYSLLFVILCGVFYIFDP